MHMQRFARFACRYGFARWRLAQTENATRQLMAFSGPVFCNDINTSPHSDLGVDVKSPEIKPLCNAQ
jgi:hypothetical protein